MSGPRSNRRFWITNRPDRRDAADYIVWRNGLGSTYTQADYDAWRANFGRSATGSAAVAGKFSAASFANIPESLSLALSVALFRAAGKRPKGITACRR
jgi:hypothetical protein